MNPSVEVTVSEDGAETVFRVVDRKGQTGTMTFGIEVLDDLTIAFMRASKIAHERFREAAHKAARERAIPPAAQ
jgi:hypothetical protein